MKKRAKLEIVKDILLLVKDNPIRPTPLLRKSALSSLSFREYYVEMLNKGFVEEVVNNDDKLIRITEKGLKFLEKYQAIIKFIDEFGL